MNSSSNSEDSAFTIDGALYTLQIDDECLYMTCIKKQESDARSLSDLKISIRLLDTVSIEYEADVWNASPNKSLGCFFPVVSHKSPCFALVVFFWDKLDGQRRKLKSIKLKSRCEAECARWHDETQRKIDECLEKNRVVRPNNLLIIVNPKAGKKKAISLHKTVISPLFKKARVKETVIFTQYSGHAVEYLESAKLCSYDGIVAIGGDGTFNEDVNGVLRNEQRLKGFSLDRTKKELKSSINFSKPQIKIGLIPTGSNNALNFTAQGTTDIETATLHIICGESHPLDVSSVHDEKGNFITFCLCSLNYGFYNTVMEYTNKTNWLGGISNYIAPLLSFLNFRYYPGEVWYLPSSLHDEAVEGKEDASKCIYPCYTCLGDFDTASDEKITSNCTHSKNNDDHDISYKGELKDLPEENSGWKKVRGPFIAVNMTSHACRFEVSPEGVFPFAHLADGTSMLMVVHEAPKLDYFNYLRSAYTAGGSLTSSFVEIHRVTAIRFSALERQGRNSNVESVAGSSGSQASMEHDHSPTKSFCSWTSDGEEITNKEAISIWVHRGLINIFAKGLELDA